MAGAVGTAVANREEARRPALALRDEIEKAQPEFARALPAHVSPDHFVRTALTLLNRVPKLAECEPRSVVLGLLDAARLGLEISDVRGQAYLIPRWDKDAGCNKASFQLGYRGSIDLAARGGITVTATEIREFDQYDVERGTRPRLVHRPPLGHRGKVIAYYAVATMPDGRTQFEVMTVNEVEEHRDKFASQKKKDGTIWGPWVDDFDAMARKTLITKVLNYLPQAIEVRRALAIETSGYDEMSVLPSSPAARATLPAATAPALTSGSSDSADDEPPRGDGQQAPPPPPPVAQATTTKAAARPKNTEKASLEQYGEVVDTKATESAPAGGEASLSGPEMIAMLAGKHGVKTSDDRARMCSQIVGREVVSSKDLRPAEQGKVIATLNALGEDVDFEFDQPPAAPVEEPTAVSEGSAAVTPAPAGQRGVSPDLWDAPTWRKKINDAHMKVSAVMPEVRRLGLALEPSVTIASLEEIAGSGIGADLYGWLEDNAVPDGGRS